MAKFLSVMVFLPKSLEHTTERGLLSLSECIDNCNKSAKSTNEALIQWIDEYENMCKAFVSRIVALCTKSESVKENLVR